MRQIDWRALRSVAVAAVVALCGGVAQAAIYTGHFDPGSNGITPGFFGDVTVDIPDSCAQEGFNQTGIEGCGFANVLESPVTIFDSPADPPPPGTASELLNFGSASIVGVFVEAGQITGFDTNVMGPQPGTLPPFFPNNFFLQFVSGHCPDGVCQVPPFCTGFDCGIGLNFAAKLAGDPIFIYQNVYDLQHQSAPAEFTSPLQRVPEPTSLALLAVAGLAWVGARRRRT